MFNALTRACLAPLLLLVACAPETDRSDSVGKDVAYQQHIATVSSPTISEAAPITDIPTPFLGVAHEVANVKNRTFPSKVSLAYRILWVIPNSAAAQIGMRTGDYIVSYDGRTLDNVAPHERESDLRNYLRAQKSVGDTLVLEVVRERSRVSVDGSALQSLDTNITDVWEHPGSKKTTQLTVKHDNLLLQLNAVLGERYSEQPLADARDIYPAFEAIKSPHGDRALNLIDTHALSNQWTQFLQRHAQDEQWSGALDNWCALDVLRYARSRPNKLLAVAETLSASLNSMASEKFTQPFKDSALLDTASHMIGSGAPQKSAWTWETDSIDMLMTQLADWLEQIGDMHQNAFSQLNTAERDELAKLSKSLSERFQHSFYIDGVDNNEDIVKNNTRFFELVNRVNLKLILSASRLAIHLNDPSLHQSLIRLVKKHPKARARSAVVIRDTSYGRIAVYGFADHEHRSNNALLIDTGGDDSYYGAVATATPAHPVSLLLDLNGHDRYSATTHFAQGGAHMGIGMLLDRRGHDRYLATLGAQGSAWIGVGILWDTHGDDYYEARHYAQGSAFLGLGILYDGGGKDVYKGALYAQGVGGPCGVGLLKDMHGDDQYYSGGEKLSSYQDDRAGSFQSASTGIGIGFRGRARGGIGIVHDVSGNDYYETANFGLGVGYFYGLGLVHDASGDDRYHASRYGLGAAAHSAAGVFIDDSGDDHYDGNYVALIGAGWDLSLAAFVDKSGNDNYMSVPRRFNIGVAAHNSFTLMVDESGRDRYIFSNHAQIWSNDYHGGVSFAFRYDLAGRDIYSGKGANNALTQTGQYGFSLDKPRNSICLPKFAARRMCFDKPRHLLK